MVTLRKIEHAEALEFYKHHPHLRDMWARYYLNGVLKPLLRARIDDHVIRWGQKKDVEEKISVLFIIEKDGKSVGFTGYFNDPLCPKDTLRMRWTGIQGYCTRDSSVGREAVRLMCEDIAVQHPDVIWLSESCPWWCFGLRRWFKKNGFVYWNDPDKDGIGIPFVSTVSLRRRVKAESANTDGSAREINNATADIKRETKSA